MPKATDHTTPTGRACPNVTEFTSVGVPGSFSPPVSAATRRSLFGTMGAMLLLTAAETGPAEAAEPDAELIAIALQVEEGERRFYEADRGIAPDLEGAELDALIDLTAKLGTRLISMRPTTPAGFLAKARAIREVMQNAIAVDLLSTVEELGEHHDLLAWSLVNDMIAAGSAMA